jgi:uncharacterized protein
MDTTANKKIIERFMNDFSAGNLQAVLDTMSESATWWVAGNFPLSGTYSKSKFKELVESLVQSLPQGLRLTPKSMIGEGDQVAVEAESYGPHKNGKVYHNQYHFVFKLRDGKIEAVREYLDTMHANDVFCI